MKNELEVINEKIVKLRYELNKAIDEGKDMLYIYNKSIELDELIAKFYNFKAEKRRKKPKNKGK